MSSLSLAHAIGTQKIRTFISGSYANPFLGGTGNGFVSVSVSVPRSTQNRVSVRVVAKSTKKGKSKHERPWPDLNEIDPEWKTEYLMHLSPYKPLKEKPRMLNLQFEKPMLKLRKIIDEAKENQETSKEDLTKLIAKMEKRYHKWLRKQGTLLSERVFNKLEELLYSLKPNGRLAVRFYKTLEPIERVHIARHPQRPTFLDHVINITDRWIELHGDRAGYDDPAIVCCLGSIEGKTYMLIGQQKGRNSKENIKRNFGMPTPHGYRKALRFMRYAEKYNFPIITFVDTPGAFADLKSEELNQGEAIANNLRSMFGIKVPIISIVIGEGGSGGALAIACANKLLMLENAVFFVASPEACAAILYKSAKMAPKAAKELRITAQGLQEIGICDTIIPEPLGGAHRDPAQASQNIKKAILIEMERLSKMDLRVVLYERQMKFRKVGVYQEIDPVDPEKKRKMKKREVPYSAFNCTEPTPHDREELKVALEAVKAQLSEAEIDKITSDENLKKLQEDIDMEWNYVLHQFGLLEEASLLHDKIGKLLGDPYADGELTPALQKRVDKLGKILAEKLARPENCHDLKIKFGNYQFALNLRMFLRGEGEFEFLEDGQEEDDEVVEMESVGAEKREDVVAGEKREG